MKNGGRRLSLLSDERADGFLWSAGAAPPPAGQPPPAADLGGALPAARDHGRRPVRRAGCSRAGRLQTDQSSPSAGSGSGRVGWSAENSRPASTKRSRLARAPLTSCGTSRAASTISGTVQPPLAAWTAPIVTGPRLASR